MEMMLGLLLWLVAVMIILHSPKATKPARSSKQASEESSRVLASRGLLGLLSRLAKKGW
jgi:hypothetical protein